MLVCYPQPGKARSREVLEAFAVGAGGRLAERPVFEPGSAAFWGTLGIDGLVRRVIEETREFYFGDNAHFDRCRGRFVRFAKNAFQVSTAQSPAWQRWKALGLALAPWRRDGRHVVVVEQSAHFLELVGAGKGWLEQNLSDIKAHTERPLRVRTWNRDKTKAASTLAADLAEAHALVTHMSAAANQALLAGVPVFVTGPCAATPMASGPLSAIESPRYPDGREEWAAGLANSQWTIEELRSGMAWRYLNREGS